ncbi:hypothetical protein ABT390_05480 [Streptomyces aurantiacus]|uniref:Uncharacterized protein n=1 Tax=Streptomyces aurantiacus JA 4570 TaxID=1286094 RepID=S3ZAI0_9ACTN|nr:hypothetical protein [Streptomyces aurantiacus]EPH39569.1 hypothetical protein STRAU_7373 [Streptomyces aurantiacus JA 4570]
MAHPARTADAHEQAPPPTHEPAHEQAPPPRPSPTVAHPAPWWRRWPAWAPRAAAAWGVAYAVVQTLWAATATGVPLAGNRHSPAALQLLLAALALAAAGACLATTRTLGPRGRRATAGALAVLIPALGWGTIGLPMHFVTLASGAGVESATSLANLLLVTAGSALLTLVAVSYRRRLRGSCPRCGQEHPGAGDGPLAHPPATTAPRPTRLAAYLLMCGLLPWSVVKTVWLFGGDAISVSGEAWQDEVESEASGAARTLATVGIDVTVLGALLGIFLLLGLLHRWGQVFPRWTLPLAGRRVPRLLPLIPAWLTGFSLALYGTLLTAGSLLMAAGVLPKPDPDGVFTSGTGLAWMVAFGGLAFGGLGWGLLIAARSYAARTRPRCVPATSSSTGARNQGS